MNALANSTVVIATDSLAPSGVGEHMLTLAAALRHSHRIVLAFPDDGDGSAFLARARDAGCDAMPIVRENTAMATILREMSASVLHVHAGVAWEGHALATAGWIAGVPTIRTEHLPYVLTVEEQRQEHLLGVGLVDRTIYVSDATHETYFRAGALGRCAVIIRNGIEEPHPKLSRAETRSLLGIAESGLVLTTVARFTGQKGYQHLLASASQVLAQFPDAYFMLIGDGPEKPAMESLATDLGITASVLFLGTRDDVPDLLAATDLFVLASLFEGLPLVVLEAMALHLPVVATRIGGTSEALGADYPWLVEPGDAASLANAITAALGDRPMRRQLGNHNRHRYKNEFMAGRMASETAALYRAVVAEGRFRA